MINNLKTFIIWPIFFGVQNRWWQKNVVLFTDSRYTIHAHATCFPFVEIVKPAMSWLCCRDRYDLWNQRTWFYDEWRWPTMPAWLLFSIALAFNPWELVMELRLIKDETEIAAIKKACSIFLTKPSRYFDYIKVGQRQSWKQRLSSILECGVGSFWCILWYYFSSWWTPAMLTRLAIGSFCACLTLDFGCLYDHYVSDMTRTIYAGICQRQGKEKFTKPFWKPIKPWLMQ